MLECVPLLKKKNWAIKGVLTNDPTIKLFCQNLSLPCLYGISALKAILKKEPVDYLFSIVNEWYLPSAILSRVQKWAINFHDSYLPAYAGTNATFWAILQGEVQHGVTWHIMSNVIDAGSILKQQKITIEPDETTASLNMKCYQIGLILFEELLEELETGKVIPQKQSLKKRSYFSRYKKPFNAGLLTWDQEAEKIERQFRAFSFSHTRNPLCSLKINLVNELVCPHRVQILDQVAQETPGKIIQLKQDGLIIAVKQGYILLSDLTDLKGNRLNIKKLCELKNIHVGTVLENLQKDVLKELKSTYQTLSKEETVWVKKFEKFYYYSLRVLPSYLRAKFTPSSINLNVACPLPVEFKEKTADLYIALLVILFYKLNHYTNFSFLYSNQTPINELAKQSKLMPVTSLLEPELRLEQAVYQILKELSALKEKEGYTEDIFLRYPNLKGVAQSFIFKQMGIGFFVTSEKNLSLFSPCQLSIGIHTSQKISLHSSLNNLALNQLITHFLSTYQEKWHLKLKEFTVVSPRERKKLNRFSHPIIKENLLLA